MNHTITSLSPEQKMILHKLASEVGLTFATDHFNTDDVSAIARQMAEQKWTERRLHALGIARLYLIKISQVVRKETDVNIKFVIEPEPEPETSSEGFDHYLLLFDDPMCSLYMR